MRGQKKYSALPLGVEVAGAGAIRGVSCGGLHTAMVTEDGRLYTWGDGRKGELGHNHDPTSKQTPRIVESLEHVFVAAVSCGGSHTLALTDNGALYSFGLSRNGQCGHGERTSLKFPRRIEHPLLLRDNIVVCVAAGNKHSMALTRTGLVLAWGCNKHGQLGLGDFEDRLEPEVVPSLRQARVAISSVSCGAIHSCLVSALPKGEVFLAGFAEHFTPMPPMAGEAGSSSGSGAGGGGVGASVAAEAPQSQPQHFFPTPRRVSGLTEPIVGVSCGQAHNLALSANHNVWAWGSSDYGQAGFGVRGNSATPRLVLDTQNIRQVSAGRYHSFALTDTGILYSWGCGEVRHNNATTMQCYKQYPTRMDKPSRHLSLAHSLLALSLLLLLFCSSFCPSFSFPQNGQLGLNSDENILLPTVVSPILGAVVGQVSCGEHHTAILTSAPWRSLGSDVVEWLRATQVDHELKQAHLRRTHRGLTNRDLARLKLDMDRWRLADHVRRNDTLREEKAYIDAESQSVQFQPELQREIQLAFKKAEKDRADKPAQQQPLQQPLQHAPSSSMKKLSFPSVRDATAGTTATAATTATSTATSTSNGGGYELDGVVAGSGGEEASVEEKTARYDPSSSATASAAPTARLAAAQAAAHHTAASLTRLPALTKKKAAAASGGSGSGAATERAHYHNQQHGSAMAQTAPLLLDGSLTVRASSSGHDHDLTARAPLHLSTNTSAAGPSARDSRAQFLRDTALMIRRMAAVVVSADKAPGAGAGAGQAAGAPAGAPAAAASSSEGGEGSSRLSRELAECLSVLFALRKEHDARVHESRRLSKRAEELRREAELLDLANAHARANATASAVPGTTAAAAAATATATASATMGATGGGADTFSSPVVAPLSPLGQRVQNLQMQLNTVTIKISETSENRRNYQLNIAHLKEEDFEHLNQLKALRKQSADTNIYLKKMLELRSQAMQERLKSEAELAQFRAEVAAYQRFVGEQLGQFQDILSVVRRQNDVRLASRAAASSKASASSAARLDALEAERAATLAESQGLSSRLLSLDLKLRHFEDSFAKISAATGLSNPGSRAQPSQPTPAHASQPANASASSQLAHCVNNKRNHPHPPPPADLALVWSGLCSVWSGIPRCSSCFPCFPLVFVVQSFSSLFFRSDRQQILLQERHSRPVAVGDRREAARSGCAVGPAGCVAR